MHIYYNYKYEHFFLLRHRIWITCINLKDDDLQMQIFYEYLKDIALFILIIQVPLILSTLVDCLRNSGFTHSVLFFFGSYILLKDYES